MGLAMTDRAAIHNRIDAALEKMRAQGLDVRSINLCPSDLDALNRVATEAFNGRRKPRMPVYALSYSDHAVRPSKRSIVWSVHGVGIAVPRRLSSKVETRPARKAA